MTPPLTLTEMIELAKSADVIRPLDFDRPYSSYGCYFGKTADEIASNVHIEIESGKGIDSSYLSIYVYKGPFAISGREPSHNHDPKGDWQKLYKTLWQFIERYQNRPNDVCITSEECEHTHQEARALLEKVKQ